MATQSLRTHRARLAQGIKDNIRRPKIGGLFWWAIAITILGVLVVASWFFSIFVFAHPEMPRNYKLLQRMEKLEPLTVFPSNGPPKGKFRVPRQVFEDYSRYNEFHLGEINSILKRDYIENYKRADRIPYLKGDFVIHSARWLTKDDVFPTGLIVYATSADFPKVHVEYVMPGKEDDRKKPELFPEGERLIAGARDAGPTDFSTPIHIARVNGDELLLTVVPLVYRYKAGDGIFLRSEPPEMLNIDGRWPVFSQEERAEKVAPDPGPEPAPASTDESESEPE